MTTKTEQADQELFRENLSDRLSLAKDRLKIVGAEATRLKRLIGAIQDILDTIDEETTTFAGRLPFQDLPGPSEKMALAAFTVRDAVKSILQRENRPMTVREIFEALQSGGKKVGGKKPTETLRATLRFYEEDFKKTPDSKWMLKKLEESGAL